MHYRRKQAACDLHYALVCHRLNRVIWRMKVAHIYAKAQNPANLNLQSTALKHVTTETYKSYRCWTANWCSNCVVLLLKTYSIYRAFSLHYTPHWLLCGLYLRCIWSEDLIINTSVLSTAHWITSIVKYNGFGRLFLYKDCNWNGACSCVCMFSFESLFKQRLQIFLLNDQS